MERINRFFWFCSAVHRQTIEKYPTEHSKYVGIGATIFFTGFFAALSGGYALYFVFSGNPWAVVYSVFFGLIWGLAIFNMDRYIVSSINKNAGSFKQLLQATPRILLAILIGLVISRSLELKIFDKEIREKLRVTYLNDQRAKIDTLNQAFQNKYAIELGKLGELKNQRDSLDVAIKEDRQKLNFEIFGNKTTETSGIVGYGPYAARKETELRKKEDYLDTLRSYIQKQEQYINGRKQFDGLLSEKLLAGPWLDSLVNVAGFADRNRMLGELQLKNNGMTDDSTYWAIRFLGLLFVFFECLPVLVKLMSGRGPYDLAVQDMEAIYKLQSSEERSVEQEVIAGVHAYRVDTAIHTRKRQVDKE
ncbi:protein of unknown function [bacterium A37T11]|nr:protein of unknown function [bacterium A37T11]